jgi:hypothetical protein
MADSVEASAGLQAIRHSGLLSTGSYRAIVFIERAPAV